MTEAPDATLTWAGDRIAAVAVRASDGPTLGVAAATAPHPLFGQAHALTVDGALASWMSAVDLTAPGEIPAIEQPDRLPPLTGSALLNVLALRAAATNQAALRYAGAYPTSALYASLCQSFDPSADEATFTADAPARAFAGTRTPIAVDFAPRPFDRRWPHPRVAVQRRGAIERVIVDGAAYLTDDRGPRRLRRTDDGAWQAELWIGDAPWGVRARLDDDGTSCAGPLALPPATGAPLGASLPPPLVAALAEPIAACAAAPLATAIHAELADLAVVWADTGDALARDRGDHLAVHVALWHRLAPHGLGRVAAALVEVLTPVVARRAQARLLAAFTAGR